MQPTVRKVLIVEDEEQVGRLLQTLVRRAGLEPVLASTLAEGESLFGENPDVVAVIMDGDVGDPGRNLNSTPLTQIIRQTFSGPIIATSGKYGEEQMANGCSHLFAKPIEGARLIAFLRSLVT